MRYWGLVFLGVLAGCSGRPAHLVAESPAMVTICAKPDDIRGNINAAQDYCERYGKAAELIGSVPGVLGTSQKCTMGDDDYVGSIVHFRCVKD